MDLISYILFINIIGFFIMFVDKKRAINNQWRISESTLILITIIGGSLGILSGMKYCRHKTKHFKFNVGVPSILVFQLIFLTLFLVKYKIP